MAQRAVEDAETLGYMWQQLQAGYLAAQLELIAGTPTVALQIIDDLRSRITFDSCRPFADRILGLEIEARAANGTLEDPTSVIGDLEPGPRTQLLRARLDCDDDVELDALVANHASWPVQQRLQAELLLTTRGGKTTRPDELTELVSRCARTGWVSPFIGLGPSISSCLESLPLAQLHPQLARGLALASRHERSSRKPPSVVRLTSRELSLLELLPTHLSYAEIGERLYLSVNTVKSNLKTLYRKLGARTRREAVEAGRHAALI